MMRLAKCPRRSSSLKLKRVRRQLWISLPNVWLRTREFGRWNLLIRFQSLRPEKYCAACWYNQIEKGRKLVSPETIAKTVKDYFAALRAMDQQAWVNTFAEDGVSHDPVGAPPINGHQK